MLDRMFLTSPSDEKIFVEDCFATHLYTGNGSTQTITNGIDLAGKGGMVWIKNRTSAYQARIVDTVRGATNGLIPSATNSTVVDDSITAFNSNGFTVGNVLNSNASGEALASWTFRKAPKFFDVVTYTGNGSTQSISHNLGTAPGTIIVKSYGAGGSWIVYHQSLGAGSRLFLNATNAATTTVPETVWGNNTTTVAPTSTAFTTGSALNASGDTYVAYLFAHDTTSDGIIQCGSYTGNGSSTGPEINLGWEAQWVLIKRATGGTASWVLVDNMRGMSVTSSNYLLYPNSTGADNGPVDWVQATATGFQIRSVTGTDFNNSGDTYVYIAIRRGPMKTPTVGTSVFSPLAVTPVTGTVRTTGFPVDLSIAKTRTLTYGSLVTDRLRGFVGNTSPNPPTLDTSSTNAETTATYSPASYAFDNTGYKDGPELNGGYPTAYWNFRRAPGFFDEVCYTGTGVARTVNHNLGVAPGIVIVKSRSLSASDWRVNLYNTLGSTTGAILQSSGAAFNDTTAWNSFYPTATLFGVGSINDVNASGETYVAYLFASCPGVSKVDSYTGNGSSQTINCGFSNGARFFLVKRTDSSGDWWVYDSARGIVAAADPALRLNSTAAEVTSADAVDTDSTGIIVNQEATCNINVNGATYIYLAIA